MRSLSAFLVISVFAATSPTSLPTGPESPRATDVLRAEKMADEARRRLELPAPSSHHGWARGGGWGSGKPKAPERRPLGTPWQAR